MSVSLILACAGKGTRAGFEKNKLLMKTQGVTYLEKTLSAFYSSGLINQYILTVSTEDFETVKSIVGENATVVLGGETRTQSVANALAVANGDIVLVHDGARPFVSHKMIKDCIATASEKGSAIPIVPTRDTLLKADSGYIDEYLGKSGIYSVQTPQGFRTAHIKEAYSQIANGTFNDDGEIYGKFIGKVATYPGDIKNIKLTFPEDFEENEQKLGYRFGTGFDCHKLVENRKLILGGVEIPHDKGLLGHSDADVLTHAIMDSILSAISERDIGYHFPDTDERFRGADSMKLLEEVIKIANKKGYKIDSLSACIMAQKPKLLGHIPKITLNISSACDIAVYKVGITATTLEGLGFVGREEGICVHATATLISID